jgi:hypothetical protein
VYIGLEDGVYMSTQDAGIRQDLIANGVERELQSITENVDAPQDLGSAFGSEVEHDLLVWPREYLETYLDRDKNGSIPLNQVQLQDLLEAAFDRDEELARNAVTSLKKTTNDTRTQLVQQGRQPALTDSGVYSGRIVSETADLLIQQISAATEVAHPKSLLAEVPQIGQLVRIAYQNNVASIRELQPRRLERELER